LSNLAEHAFPGGLPQCNWSKPKNSFEIGGCL
jgi:hypothetical protein